MRHRILIAACVLLAAALSTGLALTGGLVHLDPILGPRFGTDPEVIAVFLLILAGPALVAAGWTARDLREPLTLIWDPPDPAAGDRETVAPMRPAHLLWTGVVIAAPLGILGFLGAGTVAVQALPRHELAWLLFGAWMAVPVALRAGGLLLGAWAVSPSLAADARWMRRRAGFAGLLLLLVVGYLAGLLAAETLTHATSAAGAIPDPRRPDIMDVLFAWSAVYIGAIGAVVFWWRRRN